MKKHSDDYGTIEYKEVSVKDGDVVVVRAGISQDSIDSLSDMLGSSGRPNSIIVAVNKMSDIKSLDENIMANYGWYKSDRAKLTVKFLESRIIEERARDNDLAIMYNSVYYILTGRYYE